MAAKSKRKGGSFERDVCKAISLAWTGGTRDDLFYRTASSGGRATSRSKKGQKTANAAGDVAAMDPDGFPLLRAFAFEIKRGYNAHTIQDLLDGIGAVPLYQRWIDQAIESKIAAESLHWAIIFRRDRRRTLVMYPSYLDLTNPPCVVTLTINKGRGISCTAFESFLENACLTARKTCSNALS